MFLWQRRVNQFHVTNVAKCQCDGLLSGSLAGRRFCLFFCCFLFCVFLSGRVWHGHNSVLDTIHHTVKGKKHEKKKKKRGRLDEVGQRWYGAFSLPWSPMALLTIQHPPNYPPIRSQRDKASVLVCWSNMATNLSLLEHHTHFTASASQTSAPQRALLCFRL